jgi:hypothetical protein
MTTIGLNDREVRELLAADATLLAIADAVASTQSPSLAWPQRTARAQPREHEAPATPPASGVRRWRRVWPNGLRTRRAFSFVGAAAAVVLVPLVALGAANDWWFLKHGGPTPTKAPVVVKEGVWGSHPWQLVAYPSTTDGLCIAVAPKSAATPGQGAMACATFAGVARTSSTKASPDMTITFLISGREQNGLPAYVAGPVIEKASTVELRFSNGTILRTPTFAGHGSLQDIRFYATRLPVGVQRTLRPPSTTLRRPSFPLEWVAGLDSHGNVVACLAVRNAKDGISPLTACR